MFNLTDIEQIKALGISQDQVEIQLKSFRQGFQHITLIDIATCENGILTFTESECTMLSEYFSQHAPVKRIFKFVPASGAASRMFKDLYACLSGENSSADVIDKFISHIKKFAFHDDLLSILDKNGIAINRINEDPKQTIDYLLNEKGLNYGNLPKGLLSFHKYPDHCRTAVEEQLAESIGYCLTNDKKINIHFTVSPEHESRFKKHIETIQKKYENLFHVKFDVSFSTQNHATDTIAVDMNNEPVRDSDGRLLFRPAGHGALIENLNRLNADIVFIKNIDNVVPDRLKEKIIFYKKMLGGYLLKTQNKIFSYLNLLETTSVSTEQLNEIIHFATTNLQLIIDNDIHRLSEEEKISYLFKLLNRPIRVCGMVSNKGDKGGGPFFVRNEDGTVSLQIVEEQQVDFCNPTQKAIFDRSTHFSPTDIVCGMHDYQGKPFNLKNFIDHSTGFITIKSKNGNNLKSMELPGLWNGSMAYWISIFVEVPQITFNPVKTVFDLLREEHQT